MSLLMALWDRLSCRQRKLKCCCTSAAQLSLLITDAAMGLSSAGFSGADLEGLVRCAGSMALARAREEGVGVE